MNSGVTVTGLSVGTHTVSFTSIPGWAAPSTQTVAINNGATTKAGGAYTPLPPNSAALILQTNGHGTITHTAWPQKLLVGKQYTVTAVPSSGNLFSNWVGGTTLPYNVLSTKKSYNFAMQSNLVLQANFVPNPFAPMQGTFNGLFLDSNDVAEASSGFFTLALTTSGAFTGKILTSGGSYCLPTTNPFDLSGQAEFTVPTKQSALTFKLQLDLSNPAGQQISGAISDGAWTAALIADRATFNATTNKAVNYEGLYTMAMAGSADGMHSPGGFGCATLSVGVAGLITMKGNLADGTAIGQSVSVAQDGRWPLYAAYPAPPAGNGGAVFGWLSFSNQPASTLAGTLNWFRPAGKTPAVYQAGFTNLAVPVIGSAYNPFTKPSLALTSGQVTLDGGNLPFAITNRITLSANDAITVAPGETNKLALTINKSTGAISGTFANPSNPKQTIKIYGVPAPGPDQHGRLLPRERPERSISPRRTVSRSGAKQSNRLENMKITRTLLVLLGSLLLATPVARGQFSAQTLDVPKATDTYAQGISGSNIVGYYLDTNGTFHGFLYNGSNYSTLDDPSAATGPGLNVGTFAQAIERHQRCRLLRG